MDTMSAIAGARRIPLPGNRFTLVDEADYERVAQFSWCVFARHYAGRHLRVNEGGPGSVLLHRFILGVAKDRDVDHINGDGLDNRRCNLREVTHSQNLQNRIGVDGRSQTGVRNVYYDPANGRRRPYRVQMGVNGLLIRLGSFRTLEEAEEVAIAGRKRYMTHARECGESGPDAAPQDGGVMRTFLVTLSVPVRLPSPVPPGSRRLLPILFRQAVREMAVNTDDDLTRALVYIDRVQENDAGGSPPPELDDWGKP